MPEEEYQRQLSKLRADWGELVVDRQNPGILRPTHDPLTRILLGRRAEIIAEIFNRAMAATSAWQIWN